MGLVNKQHDLYPFNEVCNSEIEMHCAMIEMPTLADPNGIGTQPFTLPHTLVFNVMVFYQTLIIEK